MAVKGTVVAAAAAAAVAATHATCTCAASSSPVCPLRLFAIPCNRAAVSTRVLNGGGGSSATSPPPDPGAALKPAAAAPVLEARCGGGISLLWDSSTTAFSGDNPAAAAAVSKKRRSLRMRRCRRCALSTGGLRCSSSAAPSNAARNAACSRGSKRGSSGQVNRRPAQASCSSCCDVSSAVFSCGRTCNPAAILCSEAASGPVPIDGSSTAAVAVSFMLTLWCQRGCQHWLPVLAADGAAPPRRELVPAAQTKAPPAAAGSSFRTLPAPQLDGALVARSCQLQRPVCARTGMHAPTSSRRAH